MIKLLRRKKRKPTERSGFLLKKIIAVLFAALILSLSGIACYCQEVPTESASPSPTVSPSAEVTGERTFSTTSAITAPEDSSAGTAGRIMWIFLMCLLGVIVIYMIINYIRIRREEKWKLENEAVKPRLIISTGYTKKDDGGNS